MAVVHWEKKETQCWLELKNKMWEENDQVEDEDDEDGDD